MVITFMIRFRATAPGCINYICSCMGWWWGGTTALMHSPPLISTHACLGGAQEMILYVGSETEKGKSMSAAAVAVPIVVILILVAAIVIGILIIFGYYYKSKHNDFGNAYNNILGIVAIFS